MADVACPKVHCIGGGLLTVMDSGNKMIMVTGEPRSGTSLQMAFLRSQGIPIAGDKYPMDDNINVDTEEGQRRLERAKELNPMGFGRCRARSFTVYMISLISGLDMQSKLCLLQPIPGGRAIKRLNVLSFKLWENEMTWDDQTQEEKNEVIMSLYEVDGDPSEYVRYSLGKGSSFLQGGL